MHIALTIAGSDSGGGAGIQADLKTFHRFGLFGTSVITAVTAQNTRGVTGWQAMPPDLIRAQIDAVIGDLRPAALKSGMLADADVVRVVALAVREHSLAPYVIDPVMVATSGDPLLERDAVAAIRDEAAAARYPRDAEPRRSFDSTGEAVEDVPGMERAARWLVEHGGSGAALVKGGHLREGDAIDVLFDSDGFETFRHPRIDTTSTHGTGCTLSAAIAAQLALGIPLRVAVRDALDYVHRAIATAPSLGSGNGPLNHFA